MRSNAVAASLVSGKYLFIAMRGRLLDSLTLPIGAGIVGYCSGDPLGGGGETEIPAGPALTSHQTAAQ